jgi:hypothetical protein
MAENFIFNCNMSLTKDCVRKLNAFVCRETPARKEDTFVAYHYFSTLMQQRKSRTRTYAPVRRPRTAIVRRQDGQLWTTPTYSDQSEPLIFGFAPSTFRLLRFRVS